MTAGQRRPVHRSALALGVTVALAAAALVTAVPASAAVPPVRNGTASMVTADALPTAQINGVVWAQTVAGDTVYAGGEFTKARPAGAPAGQQEVARGNLVAYTLSSGVMTSFAPMLNGDVRALAASPDGKTLYVGGEFTTITNTVDGSTVTQNHYRIAAFDTASGKLLTSFAPVVNYIVKAIVATSTTVYIGGQFATVNGTTRNRLAALRASDGQLTSWAPSADNQVNALALASGGTRMVVGGSFQHLANQDAYGLGSLSTADGSLQPWPVNQVVRDAGKNSAILSLTVRGNAVYGSGYVFGPGGNLEGVFSADARTGALTWIEDCHGDTYGVYAGKSAVYVASHSHSCANVGGFPDGSPRTHSHALAFSVAATGTLATQPDTNYFNFGGEPAPSMLAWFPDLAAGSYTGVTQAAWTVTGTDQYVVYGGEFPSVNGVPQQGLVRFAVPSIAPDEVGPDVDAGRFTPTLTSPSAGTVNISWTANFDDDNLPLTYQVYRDGTGGGPIFTTTAKSTFWSRPTLSYVDHVVPGSTHGYRVFVSDADGNQVRGNTVVVTVSS